MTNLEKMGNQLIELFEIYGLDRRIEKYRLSKELPDYLENADFSVGLDNFKKELGNWIFNGNYLSVVKVVNPEKFMTNTNFFQKWEYDLSTIKLFLFPVFDEDYLSIEMKYEINDYHFDWFEMTLAKGFADEEAEKDFKLIVKKGDLKKINFQRMFDEKNAIKEAIKIFRREAQSFYRKNNAKFPLEELTEEFHRLSEEIYKSQQKENEYDGINYTH